MKTTPLKAARLAQQLSLSQLAAAAQVDRGNLSRMERGILRGSPDAAARLAAVLGISELEILYPERYLEAAA